MDTGSDNEELTRLNEECNRLTNELILLKRQGDALHQIYEWTRKSQIQVGFAGIFITFMTLVFLVLRANSLMAQCLVALITLHAILVASTVNAWSKRHKIIKGERKDESKDD